MKLLKFKKTFIILLVLSSCLLFSACSKVDTTSNTENIITIGMDDSFPPMEFRDKNNNLIGFDIDVANEISKRLNVKIEFKPTDWGGVIQSLKSKRFDIILSALSVTDERKKEIDFSNPYILEKQVLVVKKDNTTIKSAEDLKGKIVGVQLGSTSENALKPFVANVKEVKKYDKNTEALQDLAIGRTEVVVVDELVARYYIKEHSEKYKILEKDLGSEPIAVGFRKDDTELKEKFNKVIDEMQKDGTMAKISSKWFGENITTTN